MRSLAFLAVLVVAASAQGQSIYTPGYSGGVGPWQPSRVGGYWYYNHSAPVYPIARPYGGGYRTFLQEEQLIETRRIRQDLEDASWRRRWGR